MNPRGFDFHFLRQLCRVLCGTNGLLKADYVIDSVLDLVKAFRGVREDFPQVSVLLNPIGQSPGDVAECPVPFDPLTFSYLIMVHHEEVLELSITVLNTPPESVDIDDSLYRKTRVICDKNVYILLILSAIGTEKNHKFHRHRAVLELSFELVSLNRLGITIRVLEPCRLYFMPVMFFDEGNELVLLHETAFTFSK